MPAQVAVVDYPGFDGFLGTRASLMLDLVFLAMFAVVPVMFYSVWLVRKQRRYGLHKKLQLVLAGVLAVAVTLFEVDMRRHGWEARALAPGQTAIPFSVYCALGIHLVFAISTAVLWVVVVIAAWRKFPDPPTPGAHSLWHRRLGWAATIDMLLTSVTGWIFYWLAFV